MGIGYGRCSAWVRWSFLPNPTALVPVVDARASSNIIKSANEPHERVAAESELSKA